MSNLVTFLRLWSFLNEQKRINFNSKKISFKKNIFIKGYYNDFID